MIEFITWYLILPLLNTQWTCTIDALLSCKMWENRDKIEKIRRYDYISPIEKYRNRIWSWYKNTHTMALMEYLKDMWTIKSREEVPPREKRWFRWVLEVRNATRDRYVIESWEWTWNHAVCVIWENKDEWLILNNRWTWWWYNGYWYVKKSDKWLVYFKFE